VNNAILLVHRIEQLRQMGMPEIAAVRQGAAERYRPILMTTVTTVLGMLPLALAAGDGVELRRALAVAVLGGMLSSCLASLLLVPALHVIVEPWRSRHQDGEA
jgi:HAE1 family hydrophobic/amphiphilic exporter-1